MNPRIDDYLNDLRKNLSHMARDERDAVLAEIKDHLTEEAAHLQAKDPSMSNDVAAARAVDAFGPADEIGIAYGGERGWVGIINQQTGERLLEGIKVTGRVAGRVAIFGGRGLKGVLRFGGIAALSILGVATVLAVAAMIFAGSVVTIFQDDIREAVPRPLYGDSQSWSGVDAHTGSWTDTFEVGTGVKEFWIDMDLRADSGCGRIRLVDPSGDERYDSGNVCGDTSKSRQVTANETGQWRLEYTFVQYDGAVDVEAWYFRSADA